MDKTVCPSSAGARLIRSPHCFIDAGIRMTGGSLLATSWVDGCAAPGSLLVTSSGFGCSMGAWVAGKWVVFRALVWYKEAHIRTKRYLPVALTKAPVPPVGFAAHYVLREAP